MEKGAKVFVVKNTGEHDSECCKVLKSRGAPAFDCGSSGRSVSRGTGHQHYISVVHSLVQKADGVADARPGEDAVAVFGGAIPPLELINDALFFFW